MADKRLEQFKEYWAAFNGKSILAYYDRSLGQNEDASRITQTNN
jgi:hypothetical protein